MKACLLSARLIVLMHRDAFLDNPATVNMPSTCAKVATVSFIQAVASIMLGAQACMHSTAAKITLHYRCDLQQHHSTVAQGCDPGCFAAGGSVQDSQERPQV